MDDESDYVLTNHSCVCRYCKRCEDISLEVKHKIYLRNKLCIEREDREKRDKTR